LSTQFRNSIGGLLKQLNQSRGGRPFCPGSFPEPRAAEGPTAPTIRFSGRLGNRWLGSGLATPYRKVRRHYCGGTQLGNDPTQCVPRRRQP
jgi:hypothetical protein